MTRRAALIALLLAPSFTFAQQPFRFTASRDGKAELKFVEQVPVLTVEGGPADIGGAIGKLALLPGRRVLGYPRQLLELRGVEKLWGFFLGTGKGMFKHFPDDYRDELEAIVKSAGAE